MLLYGLFAAVAVGFFEELRWSGFVVPILKLGFGVLATGIIAGAMWAAWHLFTNVVLVSGTFSGQLSMAVYLATRRVDLLIGVPAFRVLMVWVYERTGSLLVAMLVHGSLIASTLFLGPLAISGVDLLIYDLILAAAWWIGVASIAVADHHRQLSRSPLRKQAA